MKQEEQGVSLQIARSEKWKRNSPISTAGTSTISDYEAIFPNVNQCRDVSTSLTRHVQPLILGCE